MKKTKKYYKNKKTLKRSAKGIFIQNLTPNNDLKLSNKVNDTMFKKNISYSPTINKQLVTLKSLERTDLMNCNSEQAFKLKEPLQIGIPNTGKCYYYYLPEAIKFMLKNLSANKHINTDKIIPPIQSQSNCWFNAMFVSFFISDKGRKFFHYLRQLMIEGKQTNGNVFTKRLSDAFALLNFGIDACLTGNEFAYKLNTNSIIHILYKSIPKIYRQNYPYIVDINEAGNPLLYYNSIINYLNNNSLRLLFIRNVNDKWKDTIAEKMLKVSYLPHIIVFEIFDEMANEFNKPISFSVKNGKYKLDSATVRDTTKQHFSALLTCENKEMGYDGASFHRIVPLNWKNKLNANFDWSFEGSNNYDETPLKWNFTKSYQLLFYYRIV